MAEQGRIGDIDVLAEQIAAACRRREALEGRVTGGEQTAMLAAETLTELGTALEELRVAVDELRQQNQELGAVRQSLAAEYQRYQELFEGIPDGYLVTDERGCIRKTNRVAGTLLGLDPELLVGKPLILFLAPEDRRDFYTRLAATAAGTRGEEWAVTVVPRGGPPFPASLTAMSLSRNEPGSPPGLRWLLRDLIGRQPGAGNEPAASTAGGLSGERANEAETAEGLAFEVSPTGRIHQLETLITSAAEIAFELDLARLAERISQVAAGLYGGGAGMVYLWDEETQVLVPRAWPGFGAWRSAIQLRLGEGVAGAVAERRVGLMVNDYLTSPYVLPVFVEGSDVTAVLAEPLLMHDRLLGVLTVDNSGTGRPFTEQDRETLVLFAPLAAIAIQNARVVQACTQECGHLREMAAHLVEAGEGERQRLDADLRELTFQELPVLNLNLGLSLGQLPENRQDMIRLWMRESMILVGRMGDRLRSLTERLRPSGLDEFGLPAALQCIGRHIGEGASVHVEVRAEDPVPRLPGPTEIALCRIAQEALNNVVKHARATLATLELRASPAGVSLSVTDDGVGFDPPKLSAWSGRRGWGLRVMAEWASAVGGGCRIEARPGQGTRVLVEVPR